MAKKKIVPLENPEVVETPIEVETPIKPKTYVKFLHMGRGNYVVKAFDSIEEAKAFSKDKYWVKPGGGGIEAPELLVEPGLLEIL